MTIPDYKNMSTKDIRDLPGVSDLKTSVAVKFIKALKLESQGDYEGAALALIAAVEEEDKNRQ